jgi:hypothetical protein
VAKKRLRNAVATQIPIFRTRLFILPVGCSKSVLEKLKVATETVEMPDKTTLATCQKIEMKTGAEALLLFMPDRSNASTTLHECVHAAHMALDIVGIPVDIDEDEALAYLTEWLVKMVDDLFYKKKVNYWT